VRCWSPKEANRAKEGAALRTSARLVPAMCRIYPVALSFPRVYKVRRSCRLPGSEEIVVPRGPCVTAFLIIFLAS
jgi:hypothetical protein